MSNSIRRQFRFVQGHVFCRHGDRTPGSNFFEPQHELASKEVASWLTELLTVHNTRKLNVAFPVRIMAGQRRPRDEGLGVFGSLTHRGLRQMISLGDSLRKHYSPFLSSARIEFSEVDITSSNYRRTQQSAQGLLAGLLPQFEELFADVSDASLRTSTFADVDLNQDGIISEKEFELAAQQQSNHKPLVVIKVPTIEKAYLNVYPLISEIKEFMQKLKVTMQLSHDEVESQQLTRAYLEKEVPAFAFKVLPFTWSQAQDLLVSRLSRLHCSQDGQGRRALLSSEQSMRNLFNYVDTQKQKTVSANQFHSACNLLFRDSIDKNDSSLCFQSIDSENTGAVDYAKWREFFSTLHSSFSSNSALSLRPQLQQHLDVVERTVCRTFAHWYSNRDLLKLVIGPMCRVLMESMNKAVQMSQHHEVIDEDSADLRPLNIHVGHDVTIVPLLYALGGWTGEDRWPKYAAAVRFDLFEEVRTSDGTHEDVFASNQGCNNGEKGSSNRFFVHASLATGFDALPQGPAAGIFSPNFVPLHDERRSSGLESKSSKLHMDSELLTKDGHAMPLPLDFANQLFTFRHFDKLLDCR